MEMDEIPESGIPRWSCVGGAGGDGSYIEIRAAKNVDEIQHDRDAWAVLEEMEEMETDLQWRLELQWRWMKSRTETGLRQK